jgi:hypothetical protein
MLSIGSNNSTTSTENTIFNTFEALFGGSNSNISSSGGERNETGTRFGFFNDSSLGNHSSSSSLMPTLQGNETVDILKLLELLQSSGRGSGSGSGN